MKGKWILLAGVVVFGAVLAGVFTMLRQNPDFLGGNKPAAPPTSDATPAAPLVIEGNRDVSVQGKIEARQIISVKAQSDGTIDEYLVNSGDEVVEGQLLARIKNPKLDAEKEVATKDMEKAQERVGQLESQLVAARLEAARAVSDSARIREDSGRLQRSYERQVMLNKEGATPRLTFEKAQREWDTARLELDSTATKLRVSEERAKELVTQIDAAKRILEEKQDALETDTSNLQATEMHAPVSGLLLARKGENGTEVKAGEEDILRIAANWNLLRVVVEPQPPVVARLVKGLFAEVYISELGNEPITGEISAIENGQVMVDFISPSPTVKPGLSAQVKLKVP